MKKLKITATIPVSSMADIAFLLLIFFMVTSVLKVDTDLPLELPDATGTEVKENDINISIDKEQRYYYENIMVSEKELINRVFARIQSKPESRILINAHKELPYEVLDRMFQNLREINANNVAIITKQHQRKL